MFSSLFGDLAPRQLSGADNLHLGAAMVAPQASAAAATGSGAGSVAARSEEGVVDAAPAAAIRPHCAAHRSDLQRASAMVTLLDPSRLWAAQVVRALAAASQPVQRLTLREHATLRSLAVIERTLVPPRQAARCAATTPSFAPTSAPTSTPTSAPARWRSAWRRKKSARRWPKAAG